MSRFPSHTIEDAPEGSRSLLQKIAHSSPTRRPLNAHAQMAHSPAVMAAYTSLRAVIAIASRFARMNGWTEPQITALRTGTTTGDAKIDTITSVVRDAAAHSGIVSDSVWKAAQQHGWSDTQLAEAFVYLGLTLFTAYFLNYAQTAADV